MERYFNIGWPCSAAKHYMLPAMARLPQVVSLINKEHYFVVFDPQFGDWNAKLRHEDIVTGRRFTCFSADWCGQKV